MHFISYASSFLVHWILKLPGDIYRGWFILLRVLYRHPIYWKAWSAGDCKFGKYNFKIKHLSSMVITTRKSVSTHDSNSWVNNQTSLVNNVINDFYMKTSRGKYACGKKSYQRNYLIVGRFQIRSKSFYSLEFLATMLRSWNFQALATNSGRGKLNKINNVF